MRITKKQKRRVALLLILSGISFVGMRHFLQPGEKTVCYEEFSAPTNWDKQCTKADITGNLKIPRVANEFKTVSAKSKDSMLYLFTGAAGHTGGGEWSKAVHIHVGTQTVMEWQWAACDTGDYQFWIKIKFNNSRTIYYKASDSRQPGFYRKERYIPYKGEKFRSDDGRLRFFPSVTLLVARPENRWMIHRRTIAEDYRQCYGQVPINLAMTAISIGMMDDSLTRVNEMGIEYFKFY